MSQVEAATPAPQARVGDWMMTRSGRKFWPLDPRPEDIDLSDIAWALAHQCRYNGHGRSFYSVAEHSVLLAETMPAGREAEALLHDAAEAYLGDIVRPLKSSLPQFVEAEARLERMIFGKFGLPLELKPDVKDRDTAILTDERNALFDPAVCEAHGWAAREPLGVDVVGYGPTLAYWLFMRWAVRLGLA